MSGELHVVDCPMTNEHPLDRTSCVCDAYDDGDLSAGLRTVPVGGCGGNALADRAGVQTYPPGWTPEARPTSYPINATILNEALDLLALWYGRWQGFVAGTPDHMDLRTRDLLERTGRPPKKVESQR